MPFINGGDLFTVLKAEPFLKESRAKQYLSEILLALCKLN